MSVTNGPAHSERVPAVLVCWPALELWFDVAICASLRHKFVGIDLLTLFGRAGTRFTDTVHHVV